MITRVIDTLESEGFAVQKTSFCDMCGREPLTKLHDSELPDCGAVRILKAYPELFAVHRTVSPEKGAFFVVCAPDGVIPATRMHIFDNHFPRRMLVVWMDSRGLLKARWLDEQGGQSLTSILRRIAA